MTIVAVLLVILLSGCADQQQAQRQATFSGPASLSVVPPGYYSSKPRPRNHSPPARVSLKQPPQEEEVVRHHTWEYVGDRPTQEEAVSADIHDSIDEAARALDNLRKKLRPEPR